MPTGVDVPGRAWSLPSPDWPKCPEIVCALGADVRQTSEMGTSRAPSVATIVRSSCTPAVLKCRHDSGVGGKAVPGQTTAGSIVRIVVSPVDALRLALKLIARTPEFAANSCTAPRG